MPDWHDHRIRAVRTVSDLVRLCIGKKVQFRQQAIGPLCESTEKVDASNLTKECVGTYCHAGRLRLVVARFELRLLESFAADQHQRGTTAARKTEPADSLQLFHDVSSPGVESLRQLEPAPWSTTGSADRASRPSAGTIATGESPAESAARIRGRKNSPPILDTVKNGLDRTPIRYYFREFSKIVRRGAQKS